MAKAKAPEDHAVAVTGELTGKFNAGLLPLVRSLSDLALDPRNARRHGVRNLASICDSLRDHGQQKPIVVDSKGVVRAGNGTMTAARELGWTGIAAVVYDGPNVKAFALTDNRTAELAEWDYEELSMQMRELTEESFEIVDRLGWSSDEREPLLQAEWKPGAVDDEAHVGGGHGHAGDGHVAVKFTPDQWAIICRATDVMPKVQAEDRAAAITEICRRAVQ